MAKIIEDVVVIKLSKVVKDSESSDVSISNADIQIAIEQIVQELVGDSVIVEVVTA